MEKTRTLFILILIALSLSGCRKKTTRMDPPPPPPAFASDERSFSILTGNELILETMGDIDEDTQVRSEDPSIANATFVFRNGRWNVRVTTHGIGETRIILEENEEIDSIAIFSIDQAFIMPVGFNVFMPVSGQLSLDVLHDDTAALLVGREMVFGLGYLDAEGNSQFLFGASILNSIVFSGCSVLCIRSVPAAGVYPIRTKLSDGTILESNVRALDPSALVELTLYTDAEEDPETTEIFSVGVRGTGAEGREILGVNASFTANGEAWDNAPITGAWNRQYDPSDCDEELEVVATYGELSDTEVIHGHPR